MQSMEAPWAREVTVCSSHHVTIWLNHECSSSFGISARPYSWREARWRSLQCRYRPLAPSRFETTWTPRMGSFHPSRFAETLSTSVESSTGLAAPREVGW